MKNSEFISSVRSAVRALNKDERVSSRYIYTVARSYVNSFLAQEAEQTDMRKQTNLFTYIPCIELEPVRGNECSIVGFETCDTVMKSVKQLPEIVHDNRGALILFVRDSGGNVFNYLSNSSRYKGTKKRRFSAASNTRYYYLQDNYLYIPDTEIEVVSATIFSTDTEAVNELKSELANEGCAECQESECMSVLDMEFPLPESSKYFGQVRSLTVNEVAGIWRRVVEDENPDLDSNIKSKTINAE